MWVHAYGQVVLAVWVCGAVVAGAQAAGQTQPAEAVKTGVQATLTVDRTAHNFGQIWAGGSKLNHAFMVSNTGQAELKITSVRPTGCACTLEGEYPRTLAPGASGEISVSLVTDKLNGPFRQIVTVSSNDPVRPQVKLELTGEAKPYVAVEPPTVYFAPRYDEQVQTRTVALRNNLETSLKLTLDPLSGASKWSASLREKQAGEEYELTVSFDPKGVVAGLTCEMVVLRTNIAEQPQVRIALSAVVGERLRAEPAVLSVYKPATQPASAPSATASTTTKPAPMTTLIRVSNFGAQPVKVLEAIASDPSLGLVVREQAAGQHYLVNVTMPAGYQPGPGACITVKTDDPIKPSLHIPIVSSLTPPTRSMASSRLQPAELIGKDAPPFSLTTLDGKAVSVRELSGAVAVLNFIAPGCGFCKEQMPRIEALRAAYEAKGVRFLFVGETMGRVAMTAADLAGKLKELGVAAPAAVDAGNQVGQSFNVSSYPTMLVLGKGGKVEAVNSGNSQDLETRLKSQLDALLAGKSPTATN